MDINAILFLISLIVFLGYLAEWVFRKINIPDTLVLIVVGFIIGPNVLNYINPESLGTIAPLFTTFTLLFLMFEGSLSIDLRSLAKGIGSGISIGFSNFFVSSLVVAGIFYFIIHDPVLALMLGFALGGVSSAFIIPVIKQLDIDKNLYSVLTLESALTDVLSIVFAITMIEIKVINVIEIKSILSQIAALFSVACALGVLAGLLWFVLEDKVLREDGSYMMTIAYLVLLYFITEYLGGNGAIAAMAFGIVIANSKKIHSIGKKIMGPEKKVKVNGAEGSPKPSRVAAIVSRRERDFYKEISFLLKTFFFVYIGLLLNVRNLDAVFMGAGIAGSIMLLRNMSSLLTRSYEKLDRLLINSLFARGIAPAAILLIAVEKKLISNPTIVDTVYVIITATIIFSSVRVFLYKLKATKQSNSDVKKD
ncbi:MAG: hypothetical protein GY757_31175 [bacterium]|nr:hypothetical protein [bacterium]